MEKIISFIIPSYNVAHCLSVCLDSFLIKKEEGFEQLEVIVVDDGSKDETADVAKRYTEPFPEVYRLIQKENGGHGSAINIGSREARGKYLKVVDADDWVVTEHLPLLLKKLEACEADVVLTPFHQVNMTDKCREIWQMYCRQYEINYSLEQVISAYSEFDRCLTFHGIMYRTQFYQSFHHQLLEGVFYEDQEYASIPCCHAKSIYPINLFLYQYLVGNAQQSVSEINRVKRIADIGEVAKRILKYACNTFSGSGNWQLSVAGKEYLMKKAEEIIIRYYVIAFLFQPDKKKGLVQAKNFSKVVNQISSEITIRIRKKYQLCHFMHYIHISGQLYEKLVHSRFYCFLRKKHILEKESD